MERAVLRLYPTYDKNLWISARTEGTGVSINVIHEYDTVIRTEHISDITLMDFVTDMCAGRNPVAKEDN